jgi:gamma-glutamyltranspeptidase / glutathione hydrolase
LRIRALSAAIVVALSVGGCAAGAGVEDAARVVPGPPGRTDAAMHARPDTVVSLRVVSYNIRHGRGMDGVVDLERTAAALRRLLPDVVALQEVDDAVERSGGVRQSARLGEMLGMHDAFGSFMDYQGGRYGLSILSRYPIRNVRVLRLTEGNEPRVALAVDVQQPGAQAITVVNVHFDWVRDDGFRFTQATEVARFLDALDGPWILAGDLNDEPGSRTVELFRERALEAEKPLERRFTFSSTDPVKEIDFIFAAPAAAWAARSVDVVHETVASDHFPVVAALEYRPMATQQGRRPPPAAPQSAAPQSAAPQSAAPQSAAPRPASTAAMPDAWKRVVARSGAVSSASSFASDAGVAMLRAGGNAVDAAVATAFAIGVVEPQMSGLGGSGAMLVWLQDEGQPYFLDFYAMQSVASFHRRAATPSAAAPAAAPAAASAGAEDMRIVAVPGAVAGLLEAHRRFGTLPLAQVMAPAIRLAEDGFPVGYILAQYIRSDSAKLHRFEDSRARLWPGGQPLGAGTMFRNPELAAALRAVAEHGRAGFDDGVAGRAVVAALNAGGHAVTQQDLAAYQPLWKQPLCATWRGRVLLSAPPPQTGAQVIHTLKLLEPYDLAALGLPTHSARAFDVLVSALRVGMADNRNDDPRWAAVAAAGRTTDAFASERRTLVGTGAAPAAITPADAARHEGVPPVAACAPYRPWPADALAAVPQDPTLPGTGFVPQDPAVAGTGFARQNPAIAGTGFASGPRPAPTSVDIAYAGETTHLSIVDGAGNAVALTQTNSSTFGSGAWVSGFFLNDSGARVPEERMAGGSAAWRTPTSTIAPTIVLEDGRVRLVTGAPGAGRIPTEITQTMLYVLDYGMDPMDGLRMPRVFPAAASPVVQLEHGFTPELLAQVRDLGYMPVPQALNYARLYMIVRTADGWVAVADPRHDGEPRGY